MKKRKLLGLGLISLILIMMPFTVKAKEAVTIYFFKGATCSYCAQASSFFNSLKSDEEYKDKFVVKEYEVWNDKNNENLMNAVAKEMGDKLQGVPYFVIGDKSWNGYASSYNEDIKKQILAVYNNDSYVDEIKNMIENSDQKEDTTLITVLIITGVVVLAGVALYFARRNSDDEEELEVEEEKASKNKEKKEEVKEEPKVEVKPKDNSNKSNNAKKKSSQTNKKPTTKKKSSQTNKKSVNKK